LLQTSYSSLLFKIVLVTIEFYLRKPNTLERQFERIGSINKAAPTKDCYMQYQEQYYRVSDVVLSNDEVIAWVIKENLPIKIIKK
jgi:hypothetical protein